MNRQNSEIRKSMGIVKPEVIIPMPASISEMPEGYELFLHNLKERIVRERVKAVLSANAAMIMLYWEIGKHILDRQATEGWGARVIDRLSYDLKQAFPEMGGFSPRNLKYMRKFAGAWPDSTIVQRTVAQLPWRSNLTLLDKLDDADLRLWYAEKAIEHGFGKDMLVFQIETRLHQRKGAALTNFESTLPPAESDMTAQLFKDPYIFDFLGTADPRREAELEQKLVDHIQKFLLELGQGFAFVGRQVPMEVGGSTFFLDLLFYHLKLRCYVVVELKSGKFEPGHISQLNMYCNVVNDLLCHPDDKKTIGLLLVKSKNRVVVEYSLAGYTNPIGVANWERDITNALPKELEGTLPTIEEIETELSSGLETETEL
ncbi:MAG: PDDEXK nuclease domain-containing protein [Trichlorobacter sp.]|uniref:PDDEXK nuclease domain-containing protein n=1 Tax=Trichlorobacter sp. TaxID=2911007 RepID=UPI002569F28F|nr:PDDEXK nuclease domain-containing protein [Trichlorobacter sp.]MDK9716553.1 PDDEXK nuclease domain-containing protein [Trichlorobacter sp.]